MTLLFRNRFLGFAELRDALSLTDGNLGNDIGRLEAEGHVRARRVLVGTSFQVRYAATDEGRVAYRRYLRSLHGLLTDATSGYEARDDPTASNPASAQ